MYVKAGVTKDWINYIVKDLKTNTEIKNCVEADDETGVYTVNVSADEYTDGCICTLACTRCGGPMKRTTQNLIVCLTCFQSATRTRQGKIKLTRVYTHGEVAF